MPRHETLWAVVLVVLLAIGVLAVARHAASTSTETCADCGPDHPHARPPR